MGQTNRLCVLLLFLLALVVPATLATTLHGTVYDMDLDKMENVLVEVNTEPVQRFISKDGEYSFEVPLGVFLIEVTYAEDGLNSTYQERVVVTSEGSFVFDIILFPGVNEVDELIADTAVEIDVGEVEKRPPNYFLMIGGFVILLLIVLFVGTGLYHGWIKMEKTEIRQDIASEEETLIVRLLKKNGGRLTQRELRKEIPLSEAKISLLVSELEHKGKVEKIKKGRGNIIILKK